jgi:hypothetical protein
MMEPTDVLTLCAEVAVALAGFAGIIATFQFRDGKKIRRAELVGLNIIVTTALIDTFACIVPLVLLTYGIKESTVWGLSSCIFAIPSAILLYRVVTDLKGAVRKKAIVAYHVALQTLIGVAILILILNATGVIFDREAGPYITSVVAGMFMCGLMFSQLLLYPLQRRLREQEYGNAVARNPS